MFWWIHPKDVQKYLSMRMIQCIHTLKIKRIFSSICLGVRSLTLWWFSRPLACCVCFLHSPPLQSVTNWLSESESVLEECQGVCDSVCLYCQNRHSVTCNWVSAVCLRSGRVSVSVSTNVVTIAYSVSQSVSGPWDPTAPPVSVPRLPTQSVFDSLSH